MARNISISHFVTLKSGCQRLLSTLDPKFWPMFEKWVLGKPTLLQSSWFWSHSKELKKLLRRRLDSLRGQKAHPLKRRLKGVISEKRWLYPRKRCKKWKIQTRITFFIFNQSGWMTYRWIPCMKSFRMVYHLFGGFGTGPGRDWTTRLRPGSKFFWWHQIEHPKLPGKRFLLHLFIFSKHRITLVQSFFKYR